MKKKNMNVQNSHVQNGPKADNSPNEENIKKWQSADESSLIREQERQARDRKKKKHRRKKQIAAIVVIALLAGGIWYAGWGRTLLATEVEETVSISVGLGQEVIYAQLTAVRGNEITYTVAKAVDTEELQGDTDQTTDGAGSQMPWGQGGQMPEGMEGQMPWGQGGQMPGDMSGQQGAAQSQRREGGSNDRGGWMQQSFPQGQSGGSTAQGGFSGGGFPSGGQSGGFPGGDQQGSGFPSGGFGDFGSGSGSGFGGGFSDFGGFGAGMGNGSMASTGSSADTGFTYNNVTYQLTQESVTTQIPVGTEVTTRLGTVTTFSRLAAGDRIALVVEEEAGTQIIMAVYIIG